MGFMTKKNVFIDLDGTLIDIAPRHYRVYEACVCSYGGKALPLDKYWQFKRNDTSWSDILLLSGVDVSLEGDFLKLFISKIESPEELSQDRLFADSLGTLEKLRDRHNLYLLSLRRNDLALNQEIDELGIRRFFKQILSGHSETKSGTLTKKAEIIRSIGVDPQSVVVIGDTEADIVAAQDIGATSIALRSGIRSDKFLAATNPDYLVDGIGDVVKILI